MYLKDQLTHMNCAEVFVGLGIGERKKAITGAHELCLDATKLLVVTLSRALITMLGMIFNFPGSNLVSPVNRESIAAQKIVACDSFNSVDFGGQRGQRGKFIPATSAIYFGTRSARSAQCGKESGSSHSFPATSL